MELTNCKLPERLERLQQEWRQRKASVKDWGAYFRSLGVAQPAFGSTGEWIASCVRRAEAKGPKYGGNAGNGGNGKGKGKGKGKWAMRLMHTYATFVKPFRLVGRGKTPEKTAAFAAHKPSYGTFCSFGDVEDPIEKNFLKIIDFGLSCKFTPGKPLSTKAGTPYYVAPQVLAGNYDQLSDLWSCGVIMYVLLCGYPPFFGDTDSEVLAKVRLGNFNFNPADWKNVSEDAKTLIRHLLKMNPKDRYTAEQALNHEWIKNKAPKASGVTLQSNFVDNLRGFRSQNKLKKAALHIIAGQLNEDQIKALRDTFMGLDKNGDGLLTPAELKEGLQKAGLKEIPPDLQAIMEDVDADGSGVIDYTEFLAATLDRRQYIQEDVCWSAFRVFDRNGDGKISQDELKMVLHNSEAHGRLMAMVMVSSTSRNSFR
eukprot:s288_g20.t1